MIMKSKVKMKPIYRNLIANDNGVDRVRYGNLVECLSYIHDVFFSDLETAIAGVVEALRIFEEACK